MKSPFALVVLAAALGLAAAPAQTPPASAVPVAASSIRVLKTRDPVRSLAADGARVAVATISEKTNTCARIVVWRPVKRSFSYFKTPVNCQTGSTVNDIAELAIAGNRVTWIGAVGGNVLELSLDLHKLGQKRSSLVAFATNANGEAESSPSQQLGNLHGGGSLLVYNSWEACVAIPAGWEGGQSCPEPAPGDEPITILSKQRLLKIVNGKAVELASAPDAQASGLKTMELAAVAVDSGRIATQQPGGGVTIYSSAGRVLWRVPLEVGRYTGFGLSGSRLVALRDGALEVYDIESGERLNTIPLSAGSILRDLRDGLAVAVRGRTVQVVRISDGRKLTFSAPKNSYSLRGKNAVDAQIESLGLVYSYSLAKGTSRGRVVFIPRARLLKKLG